MEVSRLVLTKETKEQLEKGLSPRQKGRLRWDKLTELEQSGELSNARTRLDIAKMLGFGDGYTSGYAYICNLVQRGHIRETLYEVKNGKKEFTYALGTMPDFVGGGNSKSSKRKRRMTRKSVDITAPSIDSVAVPVVKPKEAQAVIKYKDLSIELNNIDAATIERIVRQLAEIKTQ